jgi:AcrR family transcriptional regulator
MTSSMQHTVSHLSSDDEGEEHPSPNGESRRTAGQRVGGRSERVVRDVTRATAEELARVGYAELRVEDVAAKAGVNKTTIYRRWPTKADLVAATLRALKGSVNELPDRGALRLDLLALLREAVERASTCEGQTVHRMITLEIDNAEVASITKSLREEYHAPWIEVIERAVARGELPERSDARLVVDMILGPVFSKLRLREPVDDDFLVAVVNLVVVGAEGGGAIRERADGRRAREAAAQ